MRMSKSQGNHIALQDPPADMYGKVMSLPDDVMLDYFTLVTDVPADEIEEIRRQLASSAVNPMDVKKRLAREIVSDIHGAEAAQQAEGSFASTIQRGELPEEVREVVFRHDDWLEVKKHALNSQRESIWSGKLEERMARSAEERAELFPWSVGWSDEELRNAHTVSLPLLLAKVGLVESRTQARGLIADGAVDIDGKVCASPVVRIKVGATITVRVGKHRFLRIVDADE
jgi:tyrosyl-tRNA synthetase